MDGLTIGAPFLLGVVSSIHCSQMCGPIVLAYSLPNRANRQAAMHLAYNGGRLVTYSLLGAVAGFAGGKLIQLGKLAGVEQGAAIAAGIAMIIAGLILSGRFSATVNAGLIQIGGGMPAALSSAAGRLLTKGGVPGKLLLGAVMGFLPCGLVYAALLQAINAGSPTAGAVSMLAFGLGTAGALLSIGLFSTVITSHLGRYANVLAALSVLGMGVALLWRGLAFQAGGHPHHVHFS
jgi:sulfite exporter TauE/SafE